MSEKVVTRFAPSPTGYLHVGGARTALFNWLWARRTGGTFILRIEDTDQRRNTPTAMAQVLSDLRWLGINWDEGPEVGGPNGPYLQSQRKDIYEQYVRRLLDEHKAYYCFETPEELDAMRGDDQGHKQGFVYSRPAQFPTHQDAGLARADGRPVAVRFAMPQDQTIIVRDIVRGQISFAANELGDFIIQKSDGFPTYNFACVVDDCLMNITHVIRGQEHLMNTPGQQALWQALFPDVPLPEYVHMSVTVSAGGGKLSKRERPQALRNAIKARPNADLKALAEAGGIAIEELESFIKGKSTPDMPSIDAMAEYLGAALPEINIVDFLRSGYLPEAMVNFLALLGWNPGDDREIMSVPELIEAFDLSRLTKSNSLFDRKKLLAFNTEHIKMTPSDKLLEHFKTYLKAVDSPLSKKDDRVLTRIIELCRGARSLADIERKSRLLALTADQITPENKAISTVLTADDNKGLNVLLAERDVLAAVEPFAAETVEAALTSFAQKRGIGLKDVAQPLRVAVSGGTVSIPIFDALEMLDKDETLARIDRTITIVQARAMI